MDVIQGDLFQAAASRLYFEATLPAINGVGNYSSSHAQIRQSMTLSVDHIIYIKSVVLCGKLELYSSYTLSAADQGMCLLGALYV